MSKQTTTDFDTRLGEIFDKHTIALTKRGDVTSFDEVVLNAYEARNDIKSAVSELVEECIPRVDKPIHITLIEKIGLKRPDEWTEKDNIEKGRIIERVEIRQRFKERGIEIK